MAYKTLDHSDMRLFKNRLWKLMEENNIDTAKSLAKKLYDNNYVSVKQKDSFDDKRTIYWRAIDSVEKKIQKHLNSNTAKKLQGEYVIAYCNFFNCSADYLFGNIECQTHSTQFIHEYTGLSENAITSLTFIKKLNKGKILLFILSSLIENSEFSCNLMNEINDCFEKYQEYVNKRTLSDNLHMEAGNDIHKLFNLTNSEKYKNVLSKNQINELRDSKNSKIYRTQIHFTNILDSFLSNRIEEINKTPDTN